MPSTDLEQAVSSAAAMRRIIVDHVRTGLHHPHPAVVRQARALATEMDVAGLSIDHEIGPPPAQAPSSLKPESLLVLIWLAQGHDFPQIAHRLHISPRDARLHLRAAMVHLGARSDTNTVALAIGLGLIPPDVATHPQET
jgi:DNA-binding NarL/FixJ family response regulator